MQSSRPQLSPLHFRDFRWSLKLWPPPRHARRYFQFWPGRPLADSRKLWRAYSDAFKMIFPRRIPVCHCASAVVVSSPVASSKKKCFLSTPLPVNNTEKCFSTKMGVVQRGFTVDCVCFFFGGRCSTTTLPTSAAVVVVIVVTFTALPRLESVANKLQKLKPTLQWQSPASKRFSSKSVYRKPCQ